VLYSFSDDGNTVSGGGTQYKWDFPTIINSRWPTAPKPTSPSGRRIEATKASPISSRTVIAAFYLLD